MSSNKNLLSQNTLLRNGTYRILRPLASGGFGNTYLVCHTGLDAQMVVKEFFMKGINLRDSEGTVTVSVSDNRSTFESQLTKFKKEAQRLWRLKSPHIVGVHDIFEENGTAYYVMDYIDGQSLAAWLEQNGRPMPEADVYKILYQLLEALSAIHSASPTPLYHLDIKPGNIMMREDGSIAIIDFGASKQLSADKSGVTSTLMTYTRGYAPSEQTDGLADRIGAWTDLYAVGATLYKLLTVKQPPEPSEIINEGEDAFQFSSGVSEGMRELIVWLMQPSRKRRPQSVKEVRERLHTESTSTDKHKVYAEETVVTLHKGSSFPSSQTFTVNGVSFNMIRVEGGTFTMGATSEQGSDAGDDEKRTHQVTLSSYYIGETEVTQALWQAVMGTNPSYFKGLFKRKDRPVEKVSWDDCQLFISKLNVITGQNFRLPTEAEWEYAARGGNKSRGYKYSGSNTLGDVAWYADNSGGGTHPVKTKLPNELGIYDMSGNVCEWCEDWYGSYSSSAQTNPTGPTSGSNRVARGGGWNYIARFCRVSLRCGIAPGSRDGGLGLRLVF